MITNNLKHYNDEDIITLINAVSEGTLPYNLNNLKDILAETTTRHLGQEYVDMLGELIKFKIKNPDEVPPPQYRQIKKRPEKKPSFEKEEEIKKEKKGKFADKYHDDTVVNIPVSEIEKKEEKVEKKVIEEVKEKEEVKNNNVEKTQMPLNNENINREEEKKELRREVKKSRRERKFEEKLINPPAEIYEDIYEEEEYYEEDKFPILTFIAGLYKVLGWIMFVIYIASGVISSLMFFKDDIPVIIGLCFAGFLAALINIIIFYALSEKIELNLEIEKHLRRLK